MTGNTQLSSAEATDRVLSALGEQLGLLGEHYDLVVIGGSALLALGLISRSTRDVDVVALAGDDALMSADPLPGPLADASARVARDFGLPADWLNSEPAGMLRLGLPQGFAARLDRREYGPYLTVRFASRFDQVHFKLYALADRGGGGKHEADLRALEPTRDELIAAARWSRTHDPSEAHREILTAALSYLGVTDADLGS
jgi:Nucleotidyltransferase of unknown function (DUF6036)